MSVEFSGAPFQYNPAVTNINIDAQLAGILSNFNEDFIMDVITDSLNNRFRLYELPAPNIVYGYNMTFKQLSEGFPSNQSDIYVTANDTYRRIINKICDFYGLEFMPTEDTDLYSAAYWLYELGVSNFTYNMILFYVSYLINERESLDKCMDLSQMRRENDPIYIYSKKLFQDPKLAAIHANLEYVIKNIENNDISFFDILTCIYRYSNPNLPIYLSTIVKDTGNFYKDHYVNLIENSINADDLLLYIKMELQRIGSTVVSI